MKLKRIQVTKLFDIFDYDIPFPEEENALIITGPNGFGKTMILNIVFNLFSRKFDFFIDLVFEEIVLTLDDGVSIAIRKQSELKKIVTFSFLDGKNGIDVFHYPEPPTENSTFGDIRKHIPNVFEIRINTNKRPSIGLMPTIKDSTETILNSVKVHLIPEQRLFKKAPPSDGLNAEQQAVMVETIQIHANDLKQHIASLLENSFLKSQDMDSSFPMRLRSEKNILSEEEYGLRYSSLTKKQQQLSKFGLSESKQEFLTYSQEDAKALSVYLKDLEAKLAVFDSLLMKLALFTDILNERRFTFKTIQISRSKGFFFQTSTGGELKLEQLSSGEQHEVVLLYELIFNVKEDVLVLIDEPEISLHVTWQKEFLSDLLKIIKLQKVQVLIATHSPSIINGRWDLTYNLEKTAVK